MEKHIFQNTLFELLFKNLGTCAPKNTVHTITGRVNQSFWKSLGIPNYHW